MDKSDAKCANSGQPWSGQPSAPTSCLLPFKPTATNHRDSHPTHHQPCHYGHYFHHIYVHLVNTGRNFNLNKSVKMGCSMLLVEESHIQTIVSQGDVMSSFEISKAEYALSLTSWIEQMYPYMWKLFLAFGHSKRFLQIKNISTTLSCMRLLNYQIMYFSFWDVFL